MDSQTEITSLPVFVLLLLLQPPCSPSHVVSCLSVEAAAHPYRPNHPPTLPHSAFLSSASARWQSTLHGPPYYHCYYWIDGVNRVVISCCYFLDRFRFRVGFLGYIQNLLSLPLVSVSIPLSSSSRRPPFRVLVAARRHPLSLSLSLFPPQSYA